MTDHLTGERFAVFLLNGYRKMSIGGGGKQGLSAQVLDRLDCYRLVREYQSEAYNIGGRARAEELAAEHAASLNDG